MSNASECGEKTPRPWRQWRRSGGRVFQEPGNAHGTRAMTLALSTAADYLLPCNELIELTVPFNR